MDWGGFIGFLAFAGFAVLIGVGVLRILFSPVWNIRPKTARDILQERYARGEISEEEYRHKLSMLDR